MNNKRIVELDGLRAFAVTCVIIGHLIYFAALMPAGFFIKQVAMSAATSAVNMFFVISGLVITMLLIKEMESDGAISLKAFYARRFCRIVPPLATFLLVIFLLYYFNLILITRRDLFSSAFFLGNMGFFDTKSWFVGHTWSLSVEEQFYLIFPPLLVWMLPVQRRRFVGGLCAFYLACVVLPNIRDPLPLAQESWHQLQLLPGFSFIVVGVLCALNLEFVTRLLFGKGRLFAFLLLSALELLKLFAALSPFAAIQQVPIAFVEPLMCASLVIWCAVNPPQCGLLRLPIVQWLGACSYSIYLWQQLFTGPPSFYLGFKLSNLSVAFFGIILTATASHYLVERPSIKVGKRISEYFRGKRNILWRNPEADVSADPKARNEGAF